MQFLFQCKPEYKVPGLYVIDSIVRQSRHQFGTEKDVFAPRFARNLQQTFIHLFSCPPEDKVSYVYVLTSKYPILYSIFIGSIPIITQGDHCTTNDIL